MAADNGDLLVRWIGALDLRDEAGGTDNVEGGYAEQSLGIVNTFGLEYLSADRDGRVDLERTCKKARYRGYVYGSYGVRDN